MIYEYKKDGKGKRKFERIKCKECSADLLIRTDRKHSGLCRRCRVLGTKNPMAGKLSWNSGNKTFDSKTYYKNYIKNNRRKNREKALRLLGNKCSNCGIENLPICCWDIHHLDPNIKESSISQLFAFSWKKVEKELQKCVLLCAHCHRVVHHGTERLDENLN